MVATSWSAWAVGLLFATPLVVASYTDLTRYRIPNWLSLGMALLFPLALLMAPHPVHWLGHLATGLTMLAIGIVLFIPGWIGGGDAKLLAAIGLWLGPSLMGPAAMLIALCGGVLSLVLIVLRALRLSGEMILLRKGSPVPYGVAIAAGGLLLVHRLPMLAAP